MNAAPHFLAVMLLLLVLRDALPTHWKSRCVWCGGHVHAPDCPNRPKEDK